MRRLCALLAAASFSLPAHAHGGAGFRGPGGVPPGLHEPCDPPEPPPPPSDPFVSQSVTLLERWGDIARCRVEIRFEGLREGAEGRARAEPGPLFAATAGSLRSGDEAWSLGLRPSRYLHARHPPAALLALRGGAGRVDVRVANLRTDAAAVVIEGYVLLDSKRQEPLRLYRTGDRYLAVVHDWQGVRSFRFLSEAERRARHGDAPAEEVPFVRALETALSGRGSGALGDDTALAALAPDSAQPPFVGPDRPVEFRPRPAPEPADPEPQPPVPSCS